MWFYLILAVNYLKYVLILKLPESWYVVVLLEKLVGKTYPDRWLDRKGSRQGHKMLVGKAYIVQLSVGKKCWSAKKDLSAKYMLVEKTWTAVRQLVGKSMLVGKDLCRPDLRWQTRLVGKTHSRPTFWWWKRLSQPICLLGM
jgi:hypothetical protein